MTEEFRSRRSTTDTPPSNLRTVAAKVALSGKALPASL